MYATGDGTVACAANVAPDNVGGGASFFNVTKVRAERMQLEGNHLVIDHGSDKFRPWGHIHKKSLLVKVGDVVKRGHLVARLNNSGKSNNPHMNNELRTGKDSKAEGLPVNFVG